MDFADSAKAQVFAEIAENRHSCRAFLARPLEPERVEMLMRLAQRAPSDCNTQAWITHLVEGARLDALRKELYEHVGTGGQAEYDVPPLVRYEDEFLERRRVCGWGLYAAVGIEKGNRDASRNQAMENFRFFGAPHLAIITSDNRMGQRGLFDAGIYMGFMLLAAEALGIHAVPQAAVSNYAGFLREKLGIPPGKQIVGAVSFGIEDRQHPGNGFRTARVDIAETVVRCR